MSQEDLADRPIGLFDSGLGGLTVMRALRQKLPREKFVYFGDTARVPYGGKSRETILRYSIENAIFLLDKDIKLLVVACNTASAYAISKLQQIFSIPVIGVIEAGIECALRNPSHRHIAILGTQGTIASGAYQEEIKRRNPTVKVSAVACPLFVPLVEERLVKHPATRLIVQEYLKPLKDAAVDTLLLGCTHYPMLKQLIQEEMGLNVSIVDSASTCAEMVQLKLLDMKCMQLKEGEGHCHFYVSDDPHKFNLLANDFLGGPIVDAILIDRLRELATY